MKKLTEKITQFIENFKMSMQKPARLVLQEPLRLLWKDLFVGRSLFQWLYLIALSSVPLILEFTQNIESHDWLSLFASWIWDCLCYLGSRRACKQLSLWDH